MNYTRKPYDNADIFKGHLNVDRTYIIHVAPIN